MYQITPTQFFYPLSVLYHESGLEVTPSQEAPEGTLALWRCDDLEDGSLLGAATLQMRAGHHVLAHLAVAKPGDRGWGRNCWRWQRPRPSVWGLRSCGSWGRYRTFTANSTGWKSPGKMPLPSPNASPVTSSRWTASPALCAKCCPDENLKREPFRISCGTALFFL